MSHDENSIEPSLTSYQYDISNYLGSDTPLTIPCIRRFTHSKYSVLWYIYCPHCGEMNWQADISFSDDRVRINKFVEGYGLPAIHLMGFTVGTVFNTCLHVLHFNRSGINTASFTFISFG